MTAPLFLCIGDVDVDVLIQVDRLPTRDSKVNGALLQRVPGGMAGNVSVALARIGAPVRVLGRIGDDDDGDFVLGGLERAGVDTRFVARLSDTRTFSCISLLGTDGEKSLVKLMTDAYRPSATDLTREACAGVGHIHLTSAGDPSLCRRVVAMACAVGASCSLDVERADTPTDAADLAAAVTGFDLVFCNAESRQHLDALIGGADLSRLVHTVVTTLGEAGARVDTSDGRITSPGFRAHVRDTTGAGDCFAAACLYARHADRRDWPLALRFANRAAALSTEGLGAQSALPTRIEIEAALLG
jgi:sugar/nucleoside kinase (ribokinase family)